MMKLNLDTQAAGAAAQACLAESSQELWQRRARAIGKLSEPRVIADLGSLRINADSMLSRSSKPIRVASKSVRSRAVLDALLQLPGYQGILGFTLAEALWLAGSDDYLFDDIVVAYPTTDTASVAELSRSETLSSRITLMVDSEAHLNLIEEAATGTYPIRVAIDLDVSYRSPLLGHIGVRRSPVHTPEEAEALAKLILRRKKLTLVGLMGYEAQLAGVGDNPRGKSMMAQVLQRIQAASFRELAARRTEAVERISYVTELEFVNGGGTGSLERTSEDPSVTEIAAGSGLFGPHLFDHYRSFTPHPAVFFALPVVRKPLPDTVVLMGGGWIASGPAGDDRLPEISWPAGLNYLPREGAGEVQTPVSGEAARALGLGDAVLLRHTKAGEIAEHANSIHILEGEHFAGEVATYRGEGKVFL